MAEGGHPIAGFSDSLRSLVLTPFFSHLMYLIGKLVLDVVSEKPLITCIKSGLWKDKHAGFPLQELIAVPIF